MAQTIRLVRGSLVINKIFVGFKKSHRDVKLDTNHTTLDLEKD